MAADNIVPLGRPRSQPPPTLAELVKRVHELAIDTAKMGISHPHLQLRMAQRGKTIRDIVEIVRNGEGVSGPTRDKYGDWRIKMRGEVDGRRVHVVVAVREQDFSVVTLY